jgi:hypothetical protein
LIGDAQTAARAGIKELAQLFWDVALKTMTLAVGAIFIRAACFHAGKIKNGCAQGTFAGLPITTTTTTTTTAATTTVSTKGGRGLHTLTTKCGKRGNYYHPSNIHGGSHYMNRSSDKRLE